MKPLAKIIGALVVFGGGAYALLSPTKKAGDKTSVTVTSVDPPEIKSGAVRLKVNIACDNPTSHTLQLKKPYVQVYHIDPKNPAIINQVGNSIPSSETVLINANDRTTIKGINVQIPFTKLGSLLFQLMAGKQPKMEFEIRVSTEADGIPYMDTQRFTV